MSEENRENQEQPTIMVPTDDLDKVSEADANTVDQLAMELATIQQTAKKIAIIGPEDHNGMTEEIYAVLEKYKKLPLPNYCSLNVYSEQIYK